MKKYIFFLMGAVCFLLSSSAVHANELNIDCLFAISKKLISYS